MIAPFDKFKGKKVLVTGHTGFKGSWLAFWLSKLGAEVIGLSLPPAVPNNKSLYHILNLSESITHCEADVRDAAALSKAIQEHQPELVFHLAAQPLVRDSYSRPAYTWEVNVLGTINVLEAIRVTPSVEACVVVTSDKCYENKEQVWGYRESDPMGGFDPYSSSKGAAELAVSSWRRSFFADTGCLLASARAGNVIGGGDFSADRIVVDFVNAIEAGKDLGLRNPMATRPWQHVLDPLSGYLQLGLNLLSDAKLREAFASGWNFGPADEAVVTVEELASALVAAWGRGSVIDQSQGEHVHEAQLLKLDCSRAWSELKWRGTWGLADTVDATVAWYKAYFEGQDLVDLTWKQIKDFTQTASEKGYGWAPAV